MICVQAQQISACLLVKCFVKRLALFGQEILGTGHIPHAEISWCTNSVQRRCGVYHLQNRAVY